MRLIDHFVLATASLTEARARYARMGFTVAPDGVHPFGTYNANMYFRDGPMVETLAIRDADVCRAAIDAGNGFVANDAAYRARRGDEGFEQVVVSSEDADSDHAAFVTRGVSGGGLVSFSRKFELPDGSMGEIAAKLAFATPPGSNTGFYFACEDVRSAPVDRSEMLVHRNGAIGAKHVISCANEPARYVGFLSELLGAAGEVAGSGDAHWTAPNGRLSVITPGTLAAGFGVAPVIEGDDLLHVGMVFDVDDLKATEDLFAANRQPFERIGERLIVQVTSGAGVFFGFR